MEEMKSITFEGAPMATAGNKIEITRMPLNKIKLGRNSRAGIDKTELEGLMESIKQVGLLQPIGVVKNGTGYNIAYGNRRFLACSKLGMSHIPAIIHTSTKTADIDIKNLAENVQRKNISLTEVGRYVHLLKGEGMTKSEIAIRLGVAVGYVTTCEVAYSQVPKEFRDDLVAIHNNQRKAPGKIAAAAAMKILSAGKSFGLNQGQEKILFAAAKKDEFNTKLIPKYAKQIMAGNNNFLKTETPVKYVSLNFIISQSEYDKLHTKFVGDGPFNSVTAAMKASLMGKVSICLKTLSDK